MNLQKLAKSFFEEIDNEIGPFDRPFRFRPFPFDSGGALNFMTVGAGREPLVTYVSWDLLGNEKQKRGKLGRFELLTICDNEDWCIDILTNIGRQTLVEIFDSGDTMDVSPWMKRYSSELTGILFEESFSTDIRIGFWKHKCSLLRCIGITSQELEFSRKNGSQILVEKLKLSGVYPKTILGRKSVNLSEI